MSALQRSLRMLITRQCESSRISAVSLCLTRRFSAAPLLNRSSNALTSSPGRPPGKQLNFNVKRKLSNRSSVVAGALPSPPACTSHACRASSNCNNSSMYRHALASPPPPSLPWNITCRAAIPPPPTTVPPATFSDYSCIGPAPFLSPFATSQTLKTSLNRQRVCLLRNVCVVDVSEDEAGEEGEHAAFALKSLRMYRPRRLLSTYGSHLRNSTLEEMLYQPWQGLADGEGLVHLHAWENHHGGDPSVARHVLGASPSVTYGLLPLTSSPPSTACAHIMCRLPTADECWSRRGAASFRLGR
jgi:hypothetical protein